MLKFSADTTVTPSRPVLGIGLDQRTCDRLLKGELILFSTDGMDGMSPMQVFIIAGPDDKSIALELVNLGILTNVDQIQEDPAHPVRPADNDDIRGLN